MQALLPIFSHFDVCLGIYRLIILLSGLVAVVFAAELENYAATMKKELFPLVICISNRRMVDERFHSDL